jgi:NAD(P)H-flavin reductase
MEERIFTVKSNKLIARDVYEMKLSGDISGMQRPGQFVNIKLEPPNIRLRHFCGQPDAYI